jgi:hypothetical protein
MVVALRSASVMIQTVFSPLDDVKKGEPPGGGSPVGVSIHSVAG